MARRTIIVDEHALVGEALKELLGGREGIEIIATVQRGQDAVSAVAEGDVDLVLMDIDLDPSMSGLQATRLIKTTSPHTKVIIVTMFVDDVAVSHALQSGANGYITKNADVHTMMNVINSVMQGKLAIDPRVTKGVLSAVGTGSTRLLSQRELTVLQALADGRTTADVAHSLAIGEETVKSALKRAFRKLDVRDRAAAIAEAMRRGLIG